jgi:hypothetical protein
LFAKPILFSLQAQFLTVFQKHVPSAAANYCFALWQASPFSLKITKPRASKLGDYCYRPNAGHQITVNQNLKPEAFLITYLHEVAHLHTFKQYGTRKEPHGKEWKQAFKKILLPMMKPEVFSEKVLVALSDYAQNPKATTSGHAELRIALQDDSSMAEAGLVTAGSLSEGQVFSIGNKIFTKGELRRTRLLCTEINTGKKYTVSTTALVNIEGLGLTAGHF